MDPPQTSSTATLSDPRLTLAPDSRASARSNGSDRKRRLTSPESPGRRGSEPGRSSAMSTSSAMAVDLTDNTPLRPITLQPTESTQSSGTVMDLTDHVQTPQSSTTTTETVLPRSSLPTITLHSPSDPILGRTSSTGPARTFDEIAIPPWQPDTEATHCSVCGTPFTFFFRRHHCRYVESRYPNDEARYHELSLQTALTPHSKCGKVVCDNCSPHRITLPRQYIVRNPADEEIPPASTAWGGERVRVCNPCVPDPNFEPPRPQSSDRPLQSPSAGSSNAISPSRPGMSFGERLSERLRASGQGQGHRPQLPPNAPPQPALNLRHHRNSVSLGQPLVPSPQPEIQAALDQYRGYTHMVQHRPPEAQSAASSSSNIFPSGSNFYPPRVSNAIAPFATGPLPYPPPPHPSAPNVEVCRRCGMLLPFRAPDGSTDFIRNAHFAGQCGSASLAPSRYIRNPLGDPLAGSSSSNANTIANANVQAQLRHQQMLMMQARQHALSQSAAGTSSSSLPTFPYTRNPSQQPPFLLRRPVPMPSASQPRYAARPPSPEAARRVFAPVPTMATYPATEKDCVNAEGETMECVICLEEFEVGDELAILECFCKFHKRCIVEWYEKGSGMCPTHKIINPEGETVG